VRLGSARFCGIAPRADDGAELWLARPGRAPVRFGFAEHVRDDAAATIARLRRMGLGIRLLSGDRASSVARIAAELGIADWQSGLTPAGKVAAVAAWQRDGARVLMVGDGLNDGPALSAASVSASPSTAADLSQTVADLVFQGRKLAPVAGTIAVGRRARRVMRQNLALALFYNAVMIPVAMAGLVTPWLAAAAMSLSSLLVMANSARVRGGGG
jgi:P-type Cu2+ transporter